jgi:hypothetical protein
MLNNICKLEIASPADCPCCHGKSPRYEQNCIAAGTSDREDVRHFEDSDNGGKVTEHFRQEGRPLALYTYSIYLSILRCTSSMHDSSAMLGDFYLRSPPPPPLLPTHDLAVVNQGHDIRDGYIMHKPLRGIWLEKISKQLALVPRDYMVPCHKLMQSELARTGI